MGKVKKISAVSSVGGASQQKISAFFQGGLAKSTDKGSNLFSHVGSVSDNKSKLTLGKRQISENPSTSVDKGNVSFETGAADDAIAIPDTPKDKSGSGQCHFSVKGKENGLVSSAAASLEVTSVKFSPQAKSNQIENDSDCGIIPDTPDLLPANARKKISSRSFLTSSSHLTTGPFPKAGKKPVSKPQQNLRRKLVQSPAKSDLEKCKKEILMQSIGQTVGSLQRTTSTTSEKESSTMSVGMVRKRLSTSSGISPNPKRFSNRKTPEKILTSNTSNVERKPARNLLSQMETIGDPEDLIEATPPSKWGIKREKIAIDLPRKDNSFSSKSKVNLGPQEKKNSSQTNDDDYLDSLIEELKDSSELEESRTDIKVPKTINCTVSSNVPPVTMATEENATDAMEAEEDLDESIDDILKELKSKYTPKAESLRKENKSVAELSAMPKKSNRNLFKTPTSELKKITPKSQKTKDSPGSNNKNISMNTTFSQQDSWMLDIPIDENNLQEDKLVSDFHKLSPFKDPEKENDIQRAEALGNEEIVKETNSEREPLPIDNFGRHKVLSVKDRCSHKELELQSEINQTKRLALLEGFWQDTHVSAGDIVHILQDFDSQDVCRITDQSGLIVVHPDLLISGTSVVSGVQCMRRAVLNEKFKGVDSRNIYMLQGSIIHAFFQQVLKRQAFTAADMLTIAREILKQPQFLHEMYAQDLKESTIQEEIVKTVPHIVNFAQKYVVPKSFNLGQKMPKDDKVQIMDIADIEENIWSPRFGVKGKIDLTLDVKVRKNASEAWQRKRMPLELKTGKASFSIEHKGQVTLYSMMSCDRREDPEAGLLLYIKHGTMQTIPAELTNKKGLIQLRNEMAHYIRESQRRLTGEHSDKNSLKFGYLPTPINNERWCSKCPHLLNCALYQKALEDHVLPAGHVMMDMAPAAIAHLSQHHLDYFRHWCDLMHLEMSSDRRKKGVEELWCKSGWQREQSRECLSGMVLIPSECRTIGPDTYIQVFKRRPQHPSKVPVQQVGICENDGVVIGAENKPYIALCHFTTVTELTNDSVTVTTDRDLRLYSDHVDTVYRLDKVDTFNTMGINFTNLSNIMADNPQSTRLREIIIDKKKPEFDLTMSKTVLGKVMHVFKYLNKPQKTAILKVLMCKDYVLIKGYPGTGKTSTIVSLVRILVALGQTVLLASYTHSAVDNILLKLLKHEVKFVRLGRLERIHADVRCRAADTLATGIATVSDLDQLYSSVPVIATTCLGATASTPVLARRKFDVCIVDEASQVLQPSCFGPLSVCSKFVLVGDPLQLPPVVQSKQARDLGMAESLFARLDDTGATYELNLQYRMNSEIMRLSNELIYSGALQCGNDSVAQARLNIQNHQHTKSYPVWLYESLSGEPKKEVVFLDTDSVELTPDVLPKANMETGVTNVLEVKVLLALTLTLIKHGIKEEDIGIIAPYRQQVTLLKDTIQGQGHIKVEVNTVDQYQGRDKDVILISFVKSKDSKGPESEILKDARRLNVAVTRPRHKLVLVGSGQALQHYPPCAGLLNILGESQRVQLPDDPAQILLFTQVT